MRDRFGFVGLVALTTLAWSSIADAAPVVDKQLFRPGSTRPYFVAGTLTAPSTAAPEIIAHNYLATRPAVLRVDPATLGPARIVELKRGHLVRYDQVEDGLVVYGAETEVRIDPTGRVRWVSSRALPLPADLVTKARLTPRQALDRAGQMAGFRPGSLDQIPESRATRLVILREPAMTAPRLAYVVVLPTDPIRLQKFRSFVDAETGFVYRRENLVKRQLADAGVPPVVTCPDDSFLAYVYQTSPAEGDQICTSLSGDLDPEATQLANADVTVQNCVDEKSCTYVQNLPIVGSAWIHFCERKPVATINADGDFTDYFFESDTAPEDSFAEVQMFYHVNKVYAVARSLDPDGFTNLDQKPLTALVNLRLPTLDISAFACNNEIYTGSGELEPYDNAAFMPADGLYDGIPEADSIVFFQGTSADFAYDGDIIYHEFGHAVMAQVAPALSAGFIDRYGLDPTPAGMIEGYADLMTMFVTDDPEIGNYAGASVDAARNLDNEDTCPGSLWGEMHHDSLPLTGAMWQARQAIATTAEDKAKFDQALFAAEETFGAYDNFQTAAAKTVTEIGIAFDDTAASTAQSIFASRGLDGCDNRVLDRSTTERMDVAGTDMINGPSLVPGPLQLTYDLPVDAVSLTLDIAASQINPLSLLSGSSSTPNLEVVVKPGDDPILWTIEDTTITGDYTASQPITVDTGNNGAATATLTGAFPAGTYHVQIVNKGTSWVLQNLSISHVAGDISMDAGPTPDAGGAPDDGGGGDCGCVVGARGDHDPGLRGGALLLLALGGLILVRRRR